MYFIVVSRGLGGRTLLRGQPYDARARLISTGGEQFFVEELTTKARRHEEE
jgi:hypothetical protein